MLVLHGLLTKLLLPVNSLMVSRAIIDQTVFGVVLSSAQREDNFGPHLYSHQKKADDDLEHSCYIVLPPHCPYNHIGQSAGHMMCYESQSNRSHILEKIDHISRCSQQKELQKLQPAVSGRHTYGINTCIFMCYKPQESRNIRQADVVLYSVLYFISIYIIIVIQMLILA